MFAALYFFFHNDPHNFPSDTTKHFLSSANFNGILASRAILSYICTFVLCVEAAVLDVMGGKLRRHVTGRGLPAKAVARDGSP